MSYSVVIPNYNGREVLLPLLKQTQSWVKRDHCEVIVVDDASTDGSAQHIREKFSFVKVVEHSQNKGFPKTAHDGVEAAIHPWVLLLNNDVTLVEGSVPELIQSLERDPQVFVVSPMIIGEKKGADFCESSMRFFWEKGVLSNDRTE